MFQAPASQQVLTAAPPPRRGDSGYSLIECLLAAGLLAGVLVSISGLFLVGGRSVKSGRELTKATTIANSAMEQALGWNYDKVYGFAGATATTESQTWTTAMANPTYTGTADDVADWNATANAWRTDVQTDLHAGVLTYRVDGIDSLPQGGNDGMAPFVDAHFIRVTVTVRWTEAGNRARSVTFEEIVL